MALALEIQQAGWKGAYVKARPGRPSARRGHNSTSHAKLPVAEWTGTYAVRREARLAVQLQGGCVRQAGWRRARCLTAALVGHRVGHT